MTDQTPAVPVPAESAPDALFKYATWVHVGHGADSCSEVDEAAGVSRCGDSGHFHAWCRLPNPLQEEAIRERALAAKARRVRQLRDAGSDANEILETELETLLAEPDAKQRMADELVGTDWANDYLAAVRLVRDEDDPDAGEEGVKLFAHVTDDEARFQRLQAMSEEERPADEFAELTRHLAAYQERVRERFEAIQTPKRESFLSMDELDLLDLLRRRRIDRLGQEAFMRWRSVHEWLSCTHKQPHGESAFRDLAHLEGAAAEVLHALQEAFVDLENTAQAALGN